MVSDCTQGKDTNMRGTDKTYRERALEYTKPNPKLSLRSFSSQITQTTASEQCTDKSATTSNQIGG